MRLLVFGLCVVMPWMLLPLKPLRAAQAGSWPEPVAPRDSSHYPGEFHLGTAAESIEVRRLLQRAGLSQPTIAALEQNGFPYARVRRAVEAAARDQGYGSTNARRRGHELAQRVQRLVRLEGPSGQSVGRTAPSTSGGWRNQHVMQKLEQIGLPRSVIRALAEEGFPLAAVEEQIQEWLLDSGYNADSAARRARNLTNQIQDILPEDRARIGLPEQTSDADLRVSAIRELLQRAGLERQQISGLEQLGFPDEAVRTSVQNALGDQGYSPSSANRRAAEIALRVKEWSETQP